MSSPEAKRCKRTEEVVASRDKISSLPNDLLIRILLLVSTKDAVATMFLSKRWRYIWTMVPKLEYKVTGDECERVWKFHDRLFELHKAPVLEDLCIHLNEKRDVDVKKLVANAVDRFVRKLDLRLLWSAEPTSLPKSLYTCKTLVELTLSYKILIDVPSSACLPSLKILRLIYVFFKDEDTLERLVSSCSVLAQSRVQLVITDWRHMFPTINMFYFDFPHILVMCNTSDKFLRATSLVTSLILIEQGPNPMALYFSGSTFSLLQHFVLHPHGHLWLDLLALILNNSPKLRLLRICCGSNGYRPEYLPLSWNQPSLVPRCLSSHLEFFEWEDYRGNEEEKNLMRYMFAKSKCLKEVKITLTSSTHNLEEKEMIEKELKSMPRVSTMSELLFE